jgi:GTP cyclohydrolase I
MANIEGAIKAYAEFLSALGLTDQNAGIDVNDSASHAAELMAAWMSGVEMTSPRLSLMPAPGSDRVVLSELPFYSFCGHHFVPFFGTVNIEYVPNAHIAGLGGFLRVIDFYARRPQFQENLTHQICRHLFDELMPKSLKVTTKCRQMCLELHGKGAGIEIISEAVLPQADEI